MLVEARLLRRAAVAFCRNGGSVAKLASAIKAPRARTQGLLDGEFHWATPTVTKRILSVLDPRSRAWVEANMRCYPTISGKLPADVLAKVVEEAIEESGTITALAFDTGMHQRRIDAILHAREDAVGLTIADQIISRSLGPDRWLADDLRRWYFGTAVFATGPTKKLRRRA